MALAACTTDDQPDTFDEDGPHFEMITTPEGFTDADSGPEGWVPMLEHSGGCLVAGRGATTEHPPEDARLASMELLSAAADAEGLDPGSEPADVPFVTDGGVTDVPSSTLMFVVSDHAGDDAVRLAARAGAVFDYEGHMSGNSLELRFSCPDQIDEDLWAAVVADLRPRMVASGASEDDPWHTVTG